MGAAALGAAGVAEGVMGAATPEAEGQVGCSDLQDILYSHRV